MRTTRIFWIIGICMLLLLSGCGGGGGGGSEATTSTAGSESSGQHSTLTSVATKAASAECPNGGITVDAGIDSNGNGVLDPSEVSLTQSVCNGINGANGTNGTNGTDGEDGSDGYTTLVSMVDEPAGANCASGGKKINVGKDLNGNGTLDDSEINSHGYVCSGANGTDGANGANGTNGLNSLVSIVKDEDGECLYGGYKITSGLDKNENGVLDDTPIESEVTSTVYTCNGADGAQGPAGPGITWQNVTTTRQVQAVSNRGYIANCSWLLTITLPPASELKLGDIVQVTGATAGGWKIAQNASQRILTKNLIGNLDVWTPRYGLYYCLSDVALSGDGTRLVAVDRGVDEATGGYIYTSSDSGATWTQRDSARAWVSAASSSTGQYLIAADNGLTPAGGYLYTSSDYGETWHQRGSARKWISVDSTQDGQILIAAVNGGQIYVSLNAGIDWAVSNSDNRAWSCVAIDGTGGSRVAAVLGGHVYISDVDGIGSGSWSDRGTTNERWQSVAITPSNRRYHFAANLSGGLFRSGDYGNTWQEVISGGAFTSVAVSGDGRNVVAADISGYLYTSTDFGTTWTRRESIRSWKGVAISSDGNRMAAFELGEGPLYTASYGLPLNTTPGTGGYVIGTAYDSIALQYVGGNTFSILYHEGYNFIIK